MLDANQYNEIWWRALGGWGMALALKSTGVSVAFGVVSFFMADEDKTIRVDVSRDLLARVESPPPNTTKGYAERLARYRRKFAEIASAKYDEGLYEPEVKVLVVRVTEADLLE